MNPLRSGLLYIAWGGLALSLPHFAVAQDVPPRNVIPSSAIAQTSHSSENLAASAVLPDSPGTEWAKSQEATAQQSSSATSRPGTAATSQQREQRPVGTAAAEAPRVTGITAAEPAGVAIAPAKQRRVRTIVLKVGAIIAAGAAVGTVVALSAGTSSKPPGAH